MKKVLLSLSGGMDSGTLLGYCIDKGYHVKAISFLYGSKHNKWELRAASQLADFYQVNHYTLDLREIFSNIQSNLMLSGGGIPEGHYNDATMSQTVVPGRNHIFASILAGMAESMNYDSVMLAVHAGDHIIYPDCRPDFIYALNESVLLQSEHKVAIQAPFLNMDKTKILNIGHAFAKPVPYEFTRTCYKDQKFSCGKCGSCRERLEAWDNIAKIDPVIYE